MFGFKQFTKKDLEIKLSLDEIRKRARILVIDDDEKAFPYKLLQKEGYNIHYWKQVEKLKDLESGEYDLIILDIAGVAKAISTTDGLGVLEHLKKHNPAQLIIAYSGQKYDLSKSSFWDLADDYLGKPSDLISCKTKIDALLKDHYTPKRYWLEVEKTLQNANISEKELKKFGDRIFPSLREGKKPSAETIQRYVNIGSESLTILNTLFQIIIRFFTPAP